MKAFARTIAALALAGLVFMPAARAGELQDINQLLKSGQQAQALDRVNRYLSSRPKDAQGRFLKGLILADQNKTSEAIEVFTRLSQDYPELPEPYNNVAVLYASQGQYDKARQALEMSIRTHPAYATAYENLGDLYAKLASQSYDKALQLDSSNAAAKTKLALMTEIITNGTRSRTAVASAAPAPQPAPQPPHAAALKSVPQPPVAAAPAPAKQAAAAASAESEEVLKAVQAWAKAWSASDVHGYLAAYAPGFKTPGGESRAAWENSRKQRIAGKKIDVAVESPKVSMNGANEASVTFRQAYRSASLKTTSTKTLALVRANGKWLIQQERVGR